MKFPFRSNMTQWGSQCWVRVWMKVCDRFVSCSDIILSVISERAIVLVGDSGVWLPTKKIAGSTELFFFCGESEGCCYIMIQSLLLRSFNASRKSRTLISKNQVKTRFLMEFSSHIMKIISWLWICLRLLLNLKDR